MNYFVEGLQGSGKSTLVGKLSEKHPDFKAVREGDYSPIELAWCAYVSKDKYAEILDKYSTIADMIREKSYEEDDHVIICYTQIITDVPGFHKDLEQYEIYNGRVNIDEFKTILTRRYSRWNGVNGIFECSLFQNTVEDMILFREASDEKILDFYREIRKVLEGKEYHIFYIKAEDLAGNLSVIRKERSDDKGNEMWFPLMIGYFNDSPYAKSKGLSGEQALLDHFKHRQELELRILQEVFEGKYTLLTSKEYSDDQL